MKLRTLYKYLISATAIVMSASSAWLVSCDTKQSKGIDIEGMISAIPVQTEPNGRWGMMTVNGHLVFEDEFIEEPTLAINGLFSATEDGGISLYALGDQPKLIGKCEHLLNTGICNEGLVPVTNDQGLILIVGTNGVDRFIIKSINGKEVVSCSDLFSESMLVVTDSEGLSGCINNNGKLAIAPKYLYLSNFSEGYAVAQLNDVTGSYAIIDRTDKTVCAVKKGYVVKSTVIRNNEFVIADTAGYMCFMNLKGEISKLPAKVKAVGDYNKDLLTFSDGNDMWGIMSRNNGNDVLMRPKFKSVTLLENGSSFLVNLDDSWSVIDLKGKKSIEFGDTYSDVKMLNLKGVIRYLAKDNVGWTLFDEAGKEIFTDFNIYNVGLKETLTQGSEGPKPRFYSIDSFVESVIAMIQPNGMCGVTLNTIGNRLYKTQSPDNFVDSNEFTPDSVPSMPKGYDLTLIGVTDRVISAGIRFNKDTNKVEYAFLPNNTINAVEADITTPIKDVYNQSKEALIAALKEMGYKLIEDNEDGILMQSHYANLEITTAENDKSLTILIYRL